jgi:hypothetical protein
MKYPKYIMTAILSVFIISSCGDYRDRYDIELTEAEENAHPYECAVPEGIPDTLATGEKVEWDCDWRFAHVNGNVHFLWNDDGSLRAYAKGDGGREYLDNLAKTPDPRFK